MNMKHKSNKPIQGFTLIEMIGVLAVIAILAAILAPKVFEAIQTSKINNAVQSISTLKQAVNDHFAKKGKFTEANGTTEMTTANTTTANAFETVLVTQALITKAPVLKIGSTAAAKVPHVKLLRGVATTVAPAADYANTAAGSSFDLDALTSATTPVGKNNDAGGSELVAVFVILEVNAADAKLLNDKIDGVGEPFPAGDVTLVAENTVGKVKYTAPNAGICTVTVYLADR